MEYLVLAVVMSLIFGGGIAAGRKIGADDEWQRNQSAQQFAMRKQTDYLRRQLEGYSTRERL